MKKLTGLIAATFTPMHGDGEINLSPIPDVVETLLRQKITGLYVCGSTGEGPYLTTSERELVAQSYVESVAGRIPVVIQVGHNSIEDAKRLARHAASIGADAISAVSPSYFIPEDVSTLAATLAKIANAAPSLSFYYYHIPKLSGVSLDPVALLCAAAEQIPSLAGVKFSCRDIEVMQRCLALDDGRYNILFGVDEMLLSGVTAGCHGAVGSTYNFLAPLCHEIMRHLEQGDLACAQSCQLKAAELIAVIIRHHGISGLKTAMTLTGIPCGPPRLPLTRLTNKEEAQMKRELDALGFFTYVSRQTT